RSSAELEQEIGPADAELGQEVARQLLVVVLSSVDDARLVAEQLDQRGNLDQLRTRAQDEGDALRTETDRHPVPLPSVVVPMLVPGGISQRRAGPWASGMGQKARRPFL